MFLPGFEALTERHPGFINVTRELLVHEWVCVLPPEVTVLEVLESVTPDDEVIGACRRLRSHGYRIALDDFRLGTGRDALLDVAEIVKIDVLATPFSEIERTCHQLQTRGITLLAEKVETPEVHRRVMDLGFVLFQGYFFARPTLVQGRDIPASKLNHLRVLQEIHQPELNFDALVAIVERELSLSYKLLRYVNTCFFGQNAAVTSLRHALMLLGECEIRRWASVIILAGMATDQPEELVTEALTRGRFAEFLAPDAGMQARAPDVFLMGMLSMIDVILAQPLSTVLREIPIADDIRAALLGRPGQLRDLLDLVTSYVHGRWDQLAEPAGRLGIAESGLPTRYGQAVAWSGASVQRGDWADAA
jgi:EAL and modified HD-GYP domain-containing signal transduction protein